MKHLLLGVTGSIAAYKAADIAHAFYKQGVDVEVIMTRGATKLIAPLTFRSLTKHRAYTDVFDENYPDDVEHIALAQKTDAVLIAPATANIIGKLASGIADDMLTTTVLAVKGKPIYIAPAMNTNMWENPIVQDNIEKLRRFGFRFIEPKESVLACGAVGKGALADPSDIVKAVLSGENN